MTCLEFIEKLENEYFLDTLCDEMYLDGGFKAEIMWNAILSAATHEGVELVDKDLFNYDELLYDIYENSEKGLS